MRENGTAPETAGNGNTVTKSAHMMALERVVRTAAFLALSLVDMVFCVMMFFYAAFSEGHPIASLLLVSAAIGLAHAGAAFLFFRRFLPEFMVMMAVACGLAAMFEKYDESNGGWFWPNLFNGLGKSCVLGALFFLAAMAAFHVLGLMRKSRTKPVTFGSVFLALLLALPVLCFWDMAVNVMYLLLRDAYPFLTLIPLFLEKGVFAGLSCAAAWHWLLGRRDANYRLELACLLAAAFLLSCVYNLLGYYKTTGVFPCMTQLIGAALFAALAVPLSLRHKRRKSAAKAEAGEWLDARIASAGEGVDVLADLAGGPMVSVGSPATLAAVRECLRGARWLPKAKFLKEGDKTASGTRLDLGGNVAESGVLWFRSPGTGREQAFVFAEKDWERLADLAATVKADGTGGTLGDSSGTGAAGPGDSGEAAPGPGADG